jgi:hypothetical protein
MKSNVYSLFVYAVRSQITRDYYHRLLKIFFTILISSLTQQWDKDGIILRIPTWAFNCMIRFLKFQKERVEKEEIQEQH